MRALSRTTVLGAAAALLLCACDTTQPDRVATVEIQASTNSLYVGDEITLQAIPRDSRGNALSDRAVEWSSSASDIATISSTGTVTGRSPGTFTITAISEGAQGTMGLWVARVPVASIIVSPASVSLERGQSRQLSATPYDSRGAALSGRPVSWSSSARHVAEVDGSGWVTAVGPGTAEVTAESEGRRGVTAVTVSLAAPAVALADGRVRIHPDVIQRSSFDPGQPMWLAWIGNRFLKPFEQESSYRGLTPGQLQRVSRVNGGQYDGWYETATPVVGGCFTVAQLIGGQRRLADLSSWSGWSGLRAYEGRTVMRLPDDGRAAERLNSWIRVYTDGDRRYVRFARDVLPVEDVADPWRLVGSSDWSYPSGRSMVHADAAGIAFDASGRRRFANALARSHQNTHVWALFGHLGDGSIDLSGGECESPTRSGYRHPDVRVSGSDAGVWLDPPEMPGSPPHLFVNGMEGQVWWPNPFQPPAHVRGEFRAATAWLAAVDDMRAPEPSRVEVDYLRLYARVNGVDQLVSENHYGDGRFGGGLYTRNPWFGTHVGELRTRARLEGGSLILPLSDCSECTWHPWMEDSWRDSSGQMHWRRALPAGTQKVWVEARVRIRGPAALQLGFDYNRTTQDTSCDIDLDGDQEDGWCEAGKSHWTFESFENDGWQTITLGK